MSQFLRKYTLIALLLVICSAVAVSSVMAAAPAVVYGDATVDGNINDWDLVADFFDNMHEAGNPTKTLLSKSYVKYDCETQTLFVLVLTEPNVTADNSAKDAWVKVYDLGSSTQVDGNSASFAWVFNGQTRVGYEAAFSLAPAAYNEVEIHLSVTWNNESGRTSSTGKDKQGYTPLTIDCEEIPTQSVTIFKYNDLDKNGDQNGNEAGLQGWGIKVFEKGDDPKTATPVAGSNTDANGKIAFDLPAGGYLVCEEDRAGWTNSDPGLLCQEITVVGFNTAVAPASTILKIDVQGGNDPEYKVEFVGTSNEGKTWTYKLTLVKNATTFSSFMLDEFEEVMCVGKITAISGNGVYSNEFNKIVWLQPSVPGEFSFTLDKAYNTGVIDAEIFKTLNQYADKEIIGPNCDQPLETLVTFGNYEKPLPKPEVKLNLTAECRIGDLLYWRVTGDDETNDVNFTWNGPGTNDGSGQVDANTRYYFTTVWVPNNPNTTIISWFDPASNSNKSNTKAHNNAPCVGHVTFAKQWRGADAPDLNGAVILTAESSTSTASCTSDNGALTCVYKKKSNNSVIADLEVPFGESYSVNEAVEGWATVQGAGTGFEVVDGFDNSQLPNALVYDVADDRYCVTDANAAFPKNLAKYCTHTVINARATGDLTVTKLLDINKNGQPNIAGGEKYLGGWTIRVFAQGANPATATPLYTGVTAEGTGKVVFEDIPQGTYLVCEEERSHWTITTGTICREVVVGDNGGETLFANFENRTYIFRKVSTPATNAPVYFDWTLQNLNGDNPGDLTVISDGNATVISGGPNLFTITELVPDGWDLVKVVCNNQEMTITDNGITFDTRPAETDVDCTFYNEQDKAKIVVIKDVTGGTNDQDFNFNAYDYLPEFGLLSQFQLDDDGAESNPLNSTYSIEVEPGKYGVSEAGLLDWVVGVQCISTDDSREFPGVSADPNNNGSGIAFDIADDETITCTFSNTYTPRPAYIKVTKDIIGDKTGKFTICVGDVCKDFNGEETHTWTVEAGTYTVSEQDAGDNWNEPANQDVTVGVGETKEVTVTNTYVPSKSYIRVTKEIIGDATGTFTICVNADENCREFNGNGAQQTFEVPAGQHVVYEKEAGANWNEPQAQQVQVAEGQTVDVKVVNTYVPPVVCPGLDPYAHLSAVIEATGNPNEWRARIFNTSDCKYDVGFAAYNKYDNNNANQTLHSSDTRLQIMKGETVITLLAPQCAAQLDVFFDASHLGVYNTYLGKQAQLDQAPLVLPSFASGLYGPYGNWYGPRLLAFKHVWGPFCVDQEPVTRKITIQKASEPMFDAQVYFDGDLPDVNGGDAGDFDVNGFGGMYTFENLTPGVYNVMEIVPQGYTLTSVTCNGNPMVINNNTVAIDVTTADATCTFNNTGIFLDEEPIEPSAVQEPVVLDDDQDGVSNDFDLCAGTADATVDANGCGASQLDDDADGVNNATDACPATAAGIAVDAAGCEIPAAPQSAEVPAEVPAQEPADAPADTTTENNNG
jgi:hypothetical protein